MLLTVSSFSLRTVMELLGHAVNKGREYIQGDKINMVHGFAEHQFYIRLITSEVLVLQKNTAFLQGKLESFDQRIQKFILASPAFKIFQWQRGNNNVVLFWCLQKVGGTGIVEIDLLVRVLVYKGLNPVIVLTLFFADIEFGTASHAANYFPGKRPFAATNFENSLWTRKINLAHYGIYQKP
jgi:hypothetical protein